MGQRFGVTTVIPAELRADMPPDTMADWLQFVCEGHIRAQGYEPDGDYSITWQEITHAEVLAELETQRRDGVAEPAAPFKAGDWRVLVSVPTTRPWDLDPLPSAVPPMVTPDLPVQAASIPAMVRDTILGGS